MSFDGYIEAKFKSIIDARRFIDYVCEDDLYIDSSEVEKLHEINDKLRKSKGWYSFRLWIGDASFWDWGLDQADRFMARFVEHGMEDEFYLSYEQSSDGDGSISIAEYFGEAGYNVVVRHSYSALYYCPHCDECIEDTGAYNVYDLIRRDNITEKIICPHCGKKFRYMIDREEFPVNFSNGHWNMSNSFGLWRVYE